MVNISNLQTSMAMAVDRCAAPKRAGSPPGLEPFSPLEPFESAYARMSIEYPESASIACFYLRERVLEFVLKMSAATQLRQLMHRTSDCKE